MHALFKSQQRALVDCSGGTKQGLMYILAVLHSLYRGYTPCYFGNQLIRAADAALVVMDRNGSVLKLDVVEASRGDLE